MSVKVIDLSKEHNQFYDIDRFKEIYKKHNEFENLTNYSDKIQFWYNNDMAEHGFYYFIYEVKMSNDDIEPKVFSLEPKTIEETILFNKNLFNFYFENNYNNRIKYIKEKIEKSPLPIEYINDSIRVIEERINNSKIKFAIGDIREINNYNADWYGYESVKNNTTERLFSMDIFKTTEFMRTFAHGAIDAYIKAYLLEQLNNTERTKDSTPPPPPPPNNITPIKDITPLKPLMNTTNENEFIKIINSIYDLVKHEEIDKRADKKKVRYTTHLLIKNDWLIDSNSNKSEYIKTILQYFGYKANTKDTDEFEFPTKDTNNLITPDNNKKYSLIYTAIKGKVNSDKVH